MSLHMHIIWYLLDNSKIIVFTITNLHLYIWPKNLSWVIQKFDAVVADVTIIANRSKYVDFTLPYTDSGVTMIVPIKGIKTKNAWVFLKPLTWDLWTTTGCFFVLIGFVVWVLEHRINQDFRGPPSHQIGTGFWFSFSTMVFAHRKFNYLNYN